MKVKHITLITVVALVALLFVGAAAAEVISNNQVSTSNEEKLTTTVVTTETTKDLPAGAATTTVTAASVTGNAEELAALAKLTDAKSKKVTTLEERDAGYDQIKNSMFRVTKTGVAKRITFDDVLAASRVAAEAHSVAATNAQNAATTTNAQNAATTTNAQNAATTTNAQNAALAIVGNTLVNSDVIDLDGVAYVKVAKTANVNNEKDCLRLNNEVYVKSTSADAEKFTGLTNTEIQAAVEKARLTGASNNEIDAKKLTKVETSIANDNLIINGVTYAKTQATDASESAKLNNAANAATVSTDANNKVTFRGVTYAKVLSTDASDDAKNGWYISSAKTVSTTDDRKKGYEQIKNSMLGNKATSATIKGSTVVA